MYIVNVILNVVLWRELGLFFVFMWYFIGSILLRKSLPKARVQKIDKNAGWPYRGLYVEGEFKRSAHYVSYSLFWLRNF